MNAGEWRMFPLEKKYAHSVYASEVVRVHLMENDAVSFGFVEQRVSIRSRGAVYADVRYYVTVSSANIEDQKVKTLHEGMTIIEWLWNERKKP